jgi:hypothetical protein
MGKVAISNHRNEGESKPLYRFDLNSSYNKNIIVFSRSISSPRNTIIYYIFILHNKPLTKIRSELLASTLLS